MLTVSIGKRLQATRRSGSRRDASILHTTPGCPFFTLDAEAGITQHYIQTRRGPMTWVVPVIGLCCILTVTAQSGSAP